MTRDEIASKVFAIVKENFEIEAPEMQDDLREKYKFDSIDAVELLVHVEHMIGRQLTQDEKRGAMGIRTVKDICDFVEGVAATQSCSG